MSNSIKILDNLTANGNSLEFSIDIPESKNFSDTEFSAYLEIYGGIGGGILSLKKKLLDGTFKILKIESDDINTNFPASGEVLVRSMNYKNPNGETSKFILTLSGSTSPTLFVDGTNIKFVS